MLGAFHVSDSNNSALFSARDIHGTRLLDAGGGTSSHIRSRVVHPSRSAPGWILDCCRGLSRVELSHLASAPSDGSMDFGLSLELRLPLYDVADMRRYVQRSLRDGRGMAEEDGR